MKKIIFSFIAGFSVLETPNGDHALSPAYDLINTRIHVDDTDFALIGGLFKDNFESDEMKKNGHVGFEDFSEFAGRLNISQSRKDKLLEPFLERKPTVESLIDRSFLNDQSKRAYLIHYQTRRNNLNAQ